jgi:hypothetical protein
VQINQDPKYCCEDDSKESRWKLLRDWEYTLAGLYNNCFDKVEKKKVLLQRSQEVQIKSTVDHLQSVIKLLTKPLHLNGESGFTQYVNGCVPEYIAMNYNLLQMGLMRYNNSAKASHTYPQLAFNAANG